MKRDIFQSGFLPIALAIVFLWIGPVCFGTDFISELNTCWQTHDSETVLTFLENESSTNSTPASLAALGLANIYFRNDLIAATNKMEQAIILASTEMTNQMNTCSNRMERSVLIEELRDVILEIMANQSQEEITNHPPVSAIAIQQLFEDCPDEMPMSHIIEEL